MKCDFPDARSARARTPGGDPMQPKQGADPRPPGTEGQKSSEGPAILWVLGTGFQAFLGNTWHVSKI